MPENQHASDLQGASQLAIDAVKGITGIVEALHATILTLGVGKVADEQPTGGLTGFVYRWIDTTATVTGKALGLFFKALSPLLEDIPAHPHREAVVSAINGVLGDYLVGSGNPLAIPMQFRVEGKAVSAAEIARQVAQNAAQEGKKDALLIVVHGLCMNDLQWHRQGHDHGQALAQALGFTPVYLHYNTGQHISDNGRDFSRALQALSEALPSGTEWHVLAHSMGGLVTRSAYRQASAQALGWTRRLKKIVFLGTPHQGAVLEKGGNLVDVVLDANPYTKPFSKLGKIRSAGITDMRFGALLESDWQGKDRFALEGNLPATVPLPAEVPCYAVASTTGPAANALHDESIGDGLVTVGSALGRHAQARRQLQFPPENCWIGYGIDHLQLLADPSVYEVVERWMKH
jgi:pimeloyl-ACP methyl ester carboxylesterase